MPTLDTLRPRESVLFRPGASATALLRAALGAVWSSAPAAAGGLGSAAGAVDGGYGGASEARGFRGATGRKGTGGRERSLEE